MAVYTQVPAEQLDAFLTGFDVGRLVSCKGIAEGVENSNYLVETDGGRFILTLYENRVDPADLPWFVALLDHLARAGLPVPRFIADRGGAQLHRLCDRAAALIEFLSGISVTEPTAAQAEATGGALARLHDAVAGFTTERPNTLGPAGWRELADRCGAAALDGIAPGLATRVSIELAWLADRWPRDLPRSVIHADLFPDNVLMLDDRVSGLIDFYFACTDITAYDIAVTHAAWSFSPDGTDYREAVGAALLHGYRAERALSAEESAAMPVLARGACLRFLLTRAWDWVNTPADALVTRKDPRAFLNRLDHYAAHGPLMFAA